VIYQVQATLLSALRLSLRRATGNDVDTLMYIPGATLRGAMAAAYLESGQVDEGFRALFLNEQTTYGGLRLDGADVWPLSARVCKLYEDEHPMQDRLLEAAAGKAHSRDCSEAGCSAKLDVPKGFARLQRPPGETLARFVWKRPKQSRIAHSAIHPQLLRAASGQLFSARSLDEGQVFKGRVSAGEGAAAHLEALIGKGRRLRLGRSKTRGMGAVSLRLAARNEFASELEEEIRPRMERMQKAAAEKGGRLSGKSVVTVTLQTPASILDDFLMTPAWLDPADVSLDKAAGWELAAWFCETTSISGWHAAARVPRAEVPAIQAGSCFAFVKAGEADVEGLTKWAARLELEGVGERRSEGFGEVVVCHQMHFAPAGEEQ
jgi:CRISPR-associated protein Csx10